MTSFINAQIKTWTDWKMHLRRHTIVAKLFDAFPSLSRISGYRFGAAGLTCALLIFSAPVHAALVPLTNATQMSVGGWYKCVRYGDGAGQCLGFDNYDQIGNRYSGPLDLTGVNAVVAGETDSCAVLQDKTVRCWGDNSYGNLGNGSPAGSSATPVVTSNLAGVLFLSHGFIHRCAVLDTGSVKCWGDNFYGELGTNIAPGTVPEPVVNLTGAISVATGWYHSCALVQDGTVSCWGQNHYGQLGRVTEYDSYGLPIGTVAGLAGVTSIAAGTYHNCAVLIDKTVRCWGYGNAGQLGDGSRTYSSATPVFVAGLTGATRVAAGSNHSCALLDDRTVRCWGTNDHGQLGNGGPDVISPTPVPVVGIADAISIDAMDDHTCALLSTGAVACWGQGEGDSSGSIDTNLPVYQQKPGPSKTTMSVAQNPSFYSDLVGPITTAVNDATAFGDMTVYADGAAICSQTVKNGMATCGRYLLSPGTHTLVAKYSGDTSDAASTSDVWQQTVLRDPASAYVLSNVNPSTFGQTVSFQPGLYGNSGPYISAPTGTFTFYDGTTVFCDLPIGSYYEYSHCVISALAVGSHSITVVYSGDSFIQPSTSVALIQQVGKSASTLRLESMTNPSIFGQSVTFVASISGERPTGDVTFYADASAICSTVALTGISASCTIDSLSMGTHSISASYSGDNNNSASTSPSIGQVVNAAVPGIVLSSSLNPSTFEQVIVFTAFVTGNSPIGTITVNDGSTALCKDVAIVDASVSCGASALTIGSHSITAIYSGDANNPPSISAPVVELVSPGYVSLNPARLLDTRVGYGTVDGLYEGGGPLNSRTTLSFGATNRGGVAQLPVKAVVLNVTAVDSPSAGYLTIWPQDEMRPQTSNLNLNPRITISNLAIAGVSANGMVSVFHGGAGTSDVVADVQGYFPASSSYVPLAPVRLLDTRSGYITVDSQYQAVGALLGRHQIDLTVAGRAAIPATGVGAVVLNVTPVSPLGEGFVTIWPSGQSLPQASNLNLNSGLTIPNVAIAKVGTNGQVSLYNGSSAATDFIVDAQGWFPDTAGYTALTPVRLMDTRVGRTTIDGINAGQGLLGGGGTIDLEIANRAGIPATGVGAVVLNVTAVLPQGAGYITVWPTGEAQPQAANLSLNPGLTIPNVVVAKIGSNGSVSIYCGSLAPTDLVVDVQGWFPDSP